MKKKNRFGVIYCGQCGNLGKHCTCESEKFKNLRCLCKDCWGSAGEMCLCDICQKNRGSENVEILVDEF